jgi:hypothetical protein
VGKAFCNANFVSVQVSTTIFVADGAVSSASMNLSFMQRYIGGTH